MDSKHEKTMKESIDDFLKSIKEDESIMAKGTAVGQLCGFIASKKPSQQSEMMEYILLFAQSKGTGVTDQDLFSIAYAFLSYRNSLAYDKSEEAIVLKKFLSTICEGLTVIFNRRFGEEKTNRFLKETVQQFNSTGGSVRSFSQNTKIFIDAFKTFEKTSSEVEKLVNSNTVQGSVFKKAKTEFEKNLKSYADKLGFTEGKRKKLIQQALQNVAKLSDTDFLVQFMIAYRVIQKYPASDERKIILRGLFAENHPFRPFIDLFSNQKANVEVNGVSYSSLEAIFERFYSSVKDIQANKGLNKAIADQLMDGLIQTTITPSGEIIKKHSTLDVLIGLMAAGVIEVNGEQIVYSSAEPIFEKIIEKFATVYFANVILGKASGENNDFCKYFSNIIDQLKTQILNSKESVVNKEVLINFLEAMETLAQTKDYSNYRSYSNNNPKEVSAPITNTGTITATTTTNAGIASHQTPLSVYQNSSSTPTVFFASPNDKNPAVDIQNKDEKTSEKGGESPKPGNM